MIKQIERKNGKKATTYYIFTKNMIALNKEYFPHFVCLLTGQVPLVGQIRYSLTDLVKREAVGLSPRLK